MGVKHYRVSMDQNVLLKNLQFLCNLLTKIDALHLDVFS
jgi:hypothetical protein